MPMIRINTASRKEHRGWMWAEVLLMDVEEISVRTSPAQAAPSHLRVFWGWRESCAEANVFTIQAGIHVLGR